MKKQVLFGDKLHEDTWYSNFFCSQLLPELIESFRIHWVKQCVARGINKVWICIDGSNNDCRSKNVEYAEHGAAKSHTHVPIYGYVKIFGVKNLDRSLNLCIGRAQKV